MALTSFTIFGRAWGRPNPRGTSWRAEVAKRRAPLIFRARFAARHNIVYGSPGHLPGLPLWYLPQSAVFARRGTTFAFDTLRFVDTLRHGSSAIEIAVNLVLPLSNDGTLEVAPVRKPPLQF